MKGHLGKRKLNSHKGSYGMVGIIAGSKGITGASYLACQSALRTGSGLVYAIVPETIEMVMSIKLTEAIVKSIADDGRGYFSSQSINQVLEIISNMDAIALGPGMGVDDERVKLVNKIVSSSKSPMIIDADGINCLSKNIDILNQAKAPIIITPNLGEIARLLNLEVEKIAKNGQYYAQYISTKYNIITVLKGNKTIVASPEEEIYVNNTGNPGMATAGSGDVLTGIITSLLGQGIRPYLATTLGVYLHGLAGDIARDKLGDHGMIAGDIVDSIPYAILMDNNY